MQHEQRQFFFLSSSAKADDPVSVGDPVNYFTPRDYWVPRFRGA
jgi:hypothetical protein